MSYPSNLRNTINYITNYSRNVVKVLPNNNTTGMTVTSNGQITFTLPPNSLLDLGSLSLHANFETTPVYANNDANAHIKPRYLTRNTSSLIERLVVSVQGQTLADIQNYNLIHDIFSNYQKGIESTYKTMLSNPDCMQHYNDAGEPVGMWCCTAADGDVAYDRKPIVISDFISFLSGSPSYMDTAITGQVTIDLYLAPASHVLIEALDALYIGGNVDAPVVPEQPPAYTLNNIYMTVSKCTIDDGIYFESVANALRSGLSWSYVFNHYNTITGNVCNKNTTLRYEVSGKSIDMALFTFYHTDRNQISTLRRNNANAELLDDIANYTGAGLGANGGTVFKGSSRYLSSLGHPGVFASRYFIRDGEGVSRLSFQVNGERLPMYDMTLPDVLQNCLIDFGTANDTASGVYDGLCSSYKNWSQNFFISTCRLNHLSTDPDHYISGFDTSGTPLILQVDVTAAGQANNFLPWMCVSSTRVMKITIEMNHIGKEKTCRVRPDMLEDEINGEAMKQEYYRNDAIIYGKESQKRFMTMKDAERKVKVVRNGNGLVVLK
eukprot:768721-Hanusia_phi.AAC.7